MTAPPPRLVPYCEAPVGSPLGSAPQVVWLSGAAQVLRGLYRGPFDRDVPLPPHYWELTLATDDTVFVRTTRSNKYGYSFVLKGQKLKKAKPGDEWILSLRPDIGDEDLRNVAAAREIWIDLEQNTWVVPGEPPVFDKRKLMRLPLWTSPWKAKSGGFADGPPGAFLTTGRVTTAELLKPFGTDKRPWKVIVDHGFFRSYVQLRYFNFDTKGLAAVPPGLGIKALGKRLDQKTLTHADGVVGGGTALNDMGTVFVLHERTEEQSADVEFLCEDAAFSLSGAARRVRYIDVKSNKLERKGAAQVPAGVKEAYVLPGTWHSFGWEACIGFGPRSPWKDLRPKPADATPARSLATTLDDPLAFHLDDVVLADKEGDPLSQVPAPGSTPPMVGLYDHYLRVRQGDVANNRPQLWATKIVRPYIPADDGFAAFGEEPEQTTRLVVRENRFFDVRDKRVEPGTGKLGTVLCVGARVAIEQDHPWVDYLDGVPWLARDGGTRRYGMCQIHVIDSPYATDDRGAGVQPLSHVVVSVPCLPEPATQSDDGLFYNMMIDVEKRWSQGHPGIATGTKDYAVVPRDSAKAPKQVLRFRFILALVSADDGKALKLKRGMAGLAGAAIDHSTNTRFVNCANDALAVGSANSEDADGVKFGSHAMSHEFGHVWGIYDEYPSSTKAANVSTKLTLPVSRVPRFSQFWADGRSPMPFASDWPALMHNNRRPRMRHYWQFVEALSRQPEFFPELSDRPYVLENQHSAYEGGRLRYELVDTSKRFPGSDTVKPWDPIWQGKVGWGDGMLYRLGEDEGSVGRMFQGVNPAGSDKSPLPKDKRFDGLLVLRCYFWFDFEWAFVQQTIGDWDKDEAPLDPQFRVARRLHDELYDRKTAAPKRVFVLTPNPAVFGGQGPLLRRIAVLFQPQMEFGPHHGRTGTTDTSKVPSAGGISPQVWCIVEDDTVKPFPNPLLTGLTAQPLRFGKSQVGLSLLRYAFGIPWATFSPAPASKWSANDDPIDGAELVGIAQRVAQALGDPTGGALPTRLVEMLKTP